MTERRSPRPHVAVVGAGIAGLAAARRLVCGGARVTVLEGSPRIGGKLQVSEVAGVPVDEGAESLLTRRPEGVELLRELGLSDERVHPGEAASAIYSRGGLRPLPAGQMMGVPGDLRALAACGVLSAAGTARAALDLVLPRTPVGADVSVAGYIGARLGSEVVDRLVEPMLGGVYAGRTELLSFEATLAPVAAAARTHRSLLTAVRALRGAGSQNTGPVFTTLPDGLGTLPRALADALGEDCRIRTGAMVRELRRIEGDRWRLVFGPARDPRTLDADAVVLALPARPAARLLAEEVPAAARELEAIEYASMAIVTLAYPVTAFPRRPAMSGYLVPAVEERQVKAVTFSSVKWPHLAERAPDLIIVRCSIGRYGDEHALQRSDEELKAAAIAEIAAVCGTTGLPIDSRVTRWGGGLPQYTVGHLDRVARIRTAVAAVPGLAVAGAAYDGLGVPACIATARAAADRVLEQFESRGGADHDDGQREQADTGGQGARP